MSTTPSPPEDPCPGELDRATSCLEWSGEEECACFDPATFATSFPQTTFFEFSQTMNFVSATNPGFCKAANQRACEYYNTHQHCCCQDETLAYRKCFIDTFVVQQLPNVVGDTCHDTCNTNIEGGTSPKDRKSGGCNGSAVGIGITLCLLLACGGVYYYWYRRTNQKRANNKVESKNKKLGDHNDEKPKTDATATTGVNGVWNHMMVLLRPSKKDSSSSQQEETKEMSTTTDNVPKDIEIGRRASSASSSYGWASPSGSSSCSSSSSSSLSHDDLMKMEASHPEPHTESFGEIRSDSKHSVEKFPTANTESASLCSSMSPSPSDEENDEDDDNPARRKREASKKPKPPTESFGESFGEIRCDSKHSVEKFPTANTESASLCSSSTMSPSPSDEDDDDDDDDDPVRMEASKSKPKSTPTESSFGESFGEIRCDSKHSVEKFPTANAESASLSSWMSLSPSDEDNDEDDDDDEDCEFSEMTSTNPYPTFTSFSTMESETSRDRRHSPSSSIRKSGDPPSFVDSTKEQRHAKDKMAELDSTREELSARLRRYEQQIESRSKDDDGDDDSDGDEPHNRSPIKEDRDRLLQDYGQASLEMAQLEKEQAYYKGRVSASESEAHRLRQDRVGNTRRIVELKAQNASLKRQQQHHQQQQQKIMEEHPSTSSSSSSSQVKERPRYSRDVENPALTFLEEHRAMRNGGRGKKKSGKSMTTTSTKRSERPPKSKSERLYSSETKRPRNADTTNGPLSSKVDELCLSWLDEPQSYGR
jgi:hypothetical protein